MKKHDKKEFELGAAEKDESSEMPKEHELEMHAQDLMRAHKIKMDKSLMGHVAKHMKKKSKAMSDMADECCDMEDMSIDGLKKKRNKAFKEE